MPGATDGSLGEWLAHAAQQVLARTPKDRGPVDCGGTTPAGLAWDGSCLRVANYYSNATKITP